MPMHRWNWKYLLNFSNGLELTHCIWSWDCIFFFNVHIDDRIRWSFVCCVFPLAVKLPPAFNSPIALLMLLLLSAICSSDVNAFCMQASLVTPLPPPQQHITPSMSNYSERQETPQHIISSLFNYSERKHSQSSDNMTGLLGSKRGNVILWIMFVVCSLTNDGLVYSCDI